MTYLEPEYALKLEASLLEEVVTGQRDTGCLVWTTNPCLIAPRSYLRNQAFPDACRKMKYLGWPVYVRPTAGDVTPQGAGTFNVSTVFRVRKNEDRNVEAIYRWLCDPLIAWVESLGKTACCGPINQSFCDGSFNVAVEGRKLAGTAQRWRACSSRNGDWSVLAHAIVLVDAAIEPGVAAVNRFYECCDIEDRVRPESHINLSELHRLESGHLNLSDQEAELQRRFEAALAKIHNSVHFTQIRPSGHMITHRVK